MPIKTETSCMKPRNSIFSYHKRATLKVSKKIRNDLADYDYVHKLSPYELDWLNGFNREYVNADFKHKFKSHYSSNEHKRIVYRLNNSRNRCLYGVLKVTHRIRSLKNETPIPVPIDFVQFG